MTDRSPLTRSVPRTTHRRAGPLDRRTFLALGGAATAFALSGCGSGESGAEDEDDDHDDERDDGTEPVTGEGETRSFVPTGSLITRWAADPFAYGSYSYLAIGSSPDDRDALAADVGDRLFFAGEATSRDYAATVHGALLSGRAAAERIGAVGGPGERIVVIGAGASGLAAARDLADSGAVVTIVEARDRLGGRVHTDTTLGFPVDLGASWIHGPDGNPLSDLVEAAGVDTRVTDEDDMIVYDRDGNEIDDELLEEIDDALSDLDADLDAVVADVIDGLVADLDADEETVARYAAIAWIEHEEAADIDDLTVGALEFGEEFDGDDVMFPGGYVEILAPLAAGIEVRTGRVVEHLRYDGAVDTGSDGAGAGAGAGAGDGEVGVVIRFTDGSTMSADRVLVTVPLGVLKRGTIEFEPPLPSDKTAAIGRLGMGVLDKVVLRFEERFWDDADIIGFVGNEPGLFTEWNDLTALTGEPVIMGFNASRVARDLETRTDDEIITAALDALRTMYA